MASEIKSCQNQTTICIRLASRPLNLILGTAKIKFSQAKLKCVTPSTVLHAFCKTYAKERKTEKKENFQGQVLHYNDELMSLFSLSTPYFKLDHVLKFSGIVAGTAEGEGLVGPRPHHFFAPPPPLFALKEK